MEKETKKSEKVQSNRKKEFFRFVKYSLIAASAGLIQLGSTTILSLIWPVDKFANGPVLFYFIGLVLSVVWNLTINRKYTFKSASNMGKAVLLTIIFYLIFTPTSMLLQGWLTNGILIEGFDALTIQSMFKTEPLGLHTVVGTIICIVINFALEFPFQRFIVFGKSIDSAVKKE